MKKENNLIQWSKPTTNLLNALLEYAECVKHNRVATIEKRENTKHQNPMTKINPELENPFNWKMTCGFPETIQERESRIEKARTETEKDLIKNWEWCFSTESALNHYIKTGKVKKGLLKGTGICGNVRTSDIVKYLREVEKDSERADIFEAKRWGGLWTPKNGIPYNVAIENIETYAVYYSDDMTLSEDISKQIEIEIKRISKLI